MSMYRIILRYKRLRRIRARRQGLLPYRTCFLAAAERTQLALVEASAELQRMLDALNDGRAARGLPPLDVQLTPLGSPFFPWAAYGRRQCAHQDP